MKKIFVIGLLTSLLFSACSIEKRVYNNGYHVTWNSIKTIEPKKEKDTTENNIPKKNIKSLICEDENQIEKESQEKTFYKQKIKEIQTSERKKTETFLINKISGPKKNKIKELREKKDDFSHVRNITQSKSKNQSSTDELEELILKVLLIILLLILIGILLSLLGGILGVLFSILLFLLIIYIVLKILGLL